MRLMQLFWQATVSKILKRRAVQNFVYLLLLSTILSLAIAACAGTSLATKPEVKLNLVSFSVTKEALDQIIPKFQVKWQKEQQQKVIFEQSYGGSGAQASAVIAGFQEADVVYLALPLDVNRIQQAGLIRTGWEIRSPRQGIVSRSVAAIVTRQGNPKNIKTWEDLTKDNVKIILANPKTSGIAIWQLLTFWGSITQTGGDETAALDYVTKIYKNAPILLQNAREASDLFFKGKQGDVLINYESEIIEAEKNGAKLPYIIPQVNISIDNPVAVVDEYVDKHSTRKVAEAFVDFLYSTEAQQELAKLHFRPVNPNVSHEVTSQYPPIQTFFTAQDLGGWDLIQKEFLEDGGIFDQIQAANKS